MFKNYITISIRHLLKYKTYSFINIFGFSIALVPVILTYLYVMYEFSYDKYNSNFDQIYRVVTEYKDYGKTGQSGIVPNPLAKAMQSELPEIEYAGRMRASSAKISYNDENNHEQYIMNADPEILKIFSFKFLSGNPGTALDDPHSILFSGSMAEKYFGKENPLGKTIFLNDIYPLTVKGIFQDIPKNSHFSANFIIPVSLFYGSSSTSNIFGQQINSNAWGFSVFFTYIQLRKGTDLDELTKKIPAFLEKNSTNTYFNHSIMHFQPLKDIHLKSNMNTEQKKNGNMVTIYLYISIAFIILIIACINYINLSTARSTQRTKEIGIRKIIGAGKSQLIRQIFTETFIITFFSFIISLLLVELILPYFNSFVERDIQFNFFKNYDLFLGTFCLILMVSILSGLYPAITLSSKRPFSFMSGQNTISTNSRFRNILVALQFMLTIALVFISISIEKQLNFISEKDLGFCKNNIIYIEMHNRSDANLGYIKNELLKNRNIISVSSSSGLPVFSGSGTEFTSPEMPDIPKFQVEYNNIDYDFVDLYDMKIIQGRNFLKEYPADGQNSIIINESLAEKLGWKNPIGKTILHHTNRTVIGVVKDFNNHSLYKQVSPLYLLLNDSPDCFLSVKMRPDNMKETIGFLKNKIEIFQPKYGFKYGFISDDINAEYGSEYKLQNIFRVFSVFTILIACLGLFGLISFTTEVRKKEIGIRKVLGASPLQICRLLLRVIINMIIISSILAFPIAFYVIQKWLSSFAYKTEITILAFLGAAMAVYIIAVAAMILQILRASLQNPVNSLKYE
jgi:putative ABC transport system permease protein